MAGCAVCQGDVVIYEDRSLHGARVLASVVAGPLGDGTYDLSCQRHVRPESIRNVPAGEAVEYFSSSLNRWIPAKVHGKGGVPGTVDLDCKDGVAFSRVRLSGAAAASAPAGARPSQGGPQAASSSAPPQAPVPAPAPAAPPPAAPAAAGPGPLGLQVQEHCLYHSSTHGWIPARVLAFRQDTGNYDLDVKPGVRKDSIRCIREGDVVEYFSTSANQWIRARVIRKTTSPGHFDLDCKDNVDLSRLRPLADATSGSGTELEAARERLRSAARGKDPQAIRDALQAAVQAGIPEEETEPVERSLANLDAWVQKCRRELRQALQSGNVVTLQGAIKDAIDAGLPREEVEPAERAEEALEAKLAELRAARRQLEEAAAGRDRRALGAALRGAEAAGLPEAELEAARRALAPLLAAEARAELRSAARRQSPRGLREALQLAASAGVPREELEPVQHTLAALEARAAQARAARTQLQWAMHGQDPEVLQEALQAAATAGLTLEELNEARQALDGLEARSAARKQLRLALATGGLAELQAALRAAKQADVPKEELEAAGCRLKALEAGAVRNRFLEQLDHAMKTNDAPSLQKVLKAATAAGLSGEEVEQATRTLEAWQCAAQGREAGAPPGRPGGPVPSTQPQLGFGAVASASSSYPAASSRGPVAPTQPHLHDLPGAVPQPQGHPCYHGSNATAIPDAPLQQQFQHRGMAHAANGSFAGADMPTQPQLQHHPSASVAGNRGGVVPPTQPQLRHPGAAGAGAVGCPSMGPQAPANSGSPAPTKPQLGFASVPATDPKLGMYHQQVPDTDPQLGWAR